MIFIFCFYVFVCLLETFELNVVFHRPSLNELKLSRIFMVGQIRFSNPEQNLLAHPQLHQYPCLVSSNKDPFISL